MFYIIDLWYFFFFPIFLDKKLVWISFHLTKDDKPTINITFRAYSSTHYKHTRPIFCSKSFRFQLPPRQMKTLMKISFYYLALSLYSEIEPEPSRGPEESKWTSQGKDPVNWSGINPYRPCWCRLLRWYNRSPKSIPSKARNFASGGWWQITRRNRLEEQH